jgi:hypothetical protein
MSKKLQSPDQNNDQARVLFGLKLSRGRRDKFKQITHDCGTTMQEVMEAFIGSYVEDPDKFQIRVNMELKING